ncbi:MAG: T9SS type A sorting domain-containing protein, partial [Bacteroidota bacterium]
LEGCYDLSNPVRVVRNAASQRNSVSIYPLPATDVLHISSNILDEKNVQVAIFDMGGNDLTGKMKRIIGEMSFDITAMPAGIYILRINDGKGNIITRKVMVQ